jgi:hypothetical protein
VRRTLFLAEGILRNRAGCWCSQDPTLESVRRAVLLADAHGVRSLTLPLLFTQARPTRATLFGFVPAEGWDFLCGLAILIAVEWLCLRFWLNELAACGAAPMPKCA